MTEESEFKYDFTGLGVHEAYIVSDNLRKKINAMITQNKPQSKQDVAAVCALKEFDHALTEYIYQETRKQDLIRFKNPDTPAPPG